MTRKKIFFFIFIILFQINLLLQYQLFIIYSKNTNGFLTAFFLHITIIPSVLLFFSLIRDICKDAKQEVAMHALKEQHKIQKNQAEHIEQHQKEAAAFQQSIRQQLSQLQRYLREGDSKTALHYYQQITKDFEAVRFHPCCSDSLVNAILDHKREVAFKHNIQVNYQILLPEQIPGSSTSWACIFFNLLDNAIDACLRTDTSAPFIHLTVKYSNDFLSIHMVNSKSPAEVFSHQTAKKDVLSHGYGLSIIEEIVDTHDGSWEWMDHGDTFESIILLRLTSK